MSESIIVALITAGFPIITTAITSGLISRDNRRNAAKQSILQMILEDHIAVQEHRIPTNYQNILHEFDIYSKNGGNSYISDKVTEYKKWFSAIEKGRNRKK